MPGLAAAVATALCACATAPATPPEDPFKAAANTIERAEYDRVADYAGPEMRAARDKLTAARLLAQKAQSDQNPQEVRQAGWMAEEANADAELAAAKAQNIRAQSVVRALSAPQSAPAAGSGGQP
jgi:hypothetical protein